MTKAIESLPAAALDIGSNTIRLLVARMSDAGLETITEDSRFVRLGSGVDATGRLDPGRKEAGLHAIRELVGQAHGAGANKVYAVATSALRDATDGPEYIQQIRQACGVAVRIIDGDEEARLTFTGATLGMDLAGGALVCDMGGGSCELIRADESGITLARSLQIGSGRLTERFVGHNPPLPSERKQIEESVERTVRDGFGEVGVGVAVLTGGTASHVAYLLGLQGAAIEIQQPSWKRQRSWYTLRHRIRSFSGFRFGPSGQNYCRPGLPPYARSRLGPALRISVSRDAVFARVS